MLAVFADAAGTTTSLGSIPILDGAATVNLAVPPDAAAGAGTLILTAEESGTVVRVTVRVAGPGREESRRM